jgi:hypothetical protein
MRASFLEVLGFEPGEGRVESQRLEEGKGAASYREDHRAG